MLREFCGPLTKKLLFGFQLRSFAVTILKMAKVEALGNSSKLFVSTILCSVVFVALSAPARAANLVNVSTTASSTAPNATNVTYTLTFTTATALNEYNRLLLALFPPDVSLPYTQPCSSTISVSINAVPQNVATLLGGVCSMAPNIIQLILGPGQSVSAGSIVQVTIPDGTNGNPFPTSSFLIFQTQFDFASPEPTLGPATITPTAVPTPMLNPWALLALTLMIGGTGYWCLRRQSQERV